jgi:hypothetical protein
LEEHAANLFHLEDGGSKVSAKYTAALFQLGYGDSNISEERVAFISCSEDGDSVFQILLITNCKASCPRHSAAKKLICSENLTYSFSIKIFRSV